MFLLPPFLLGFTGSSNAQSVVRSTIAGVPSQLEHLEALAVHRPMLLRLKIKYCLYQPSIFQYLTQVSIVFSQNLDYGRRLAMFSSSVLIYLRETLGRLYHYHLSSTISIVERQ